MSDTTLLEIATAVGEATSDMRKTIARLTAENEHLEVENYRLRADLGKARLLADLRQDLWALRLREDIRTEFDLSADEVPALLKRQAD